MIFAPAYWENGVYIYQTISAEEAQQQAESLRDWLIERVVEQLKKMPIKESYSVDVSVESYRKIGAIYEADVKVVITDRLKKRVYNTRERLEQNYRWIEKCPRERNSKISRI